MVNSHPNQLGNSVDRNKILDRNPVSGPGHVITIIPILILWHLWKARNDSKHRKISVNHNRIIWRVSDHLQMLISSKLLTFKQWSGYKEIAADIGVYWQPINKDKTVRVQWIKPATGWVKLNIDGSSKGNPGRAAIGGLARDHKGKILFAFHEQIGFQNNIYAELLAILRGTEMCKARNYQYIWIESDSRVAVNLLQKKQNGNWRLQHIITSLQNILAELTYTISHIFREGNKAADLLANLNIEGENTLIFQPPHLPQCLKGITYWEARDYPNFRF